MKIYLRLKRQYQLLIELIRNYPERALLFFVTYMVVSHFNK